MSRIRHQSIALAVVAILSVSTDSRAGLTLTPAATAEGFSLSTFASGFPNSGNVGPLGIAFLSSGGVMVADDPGNVRVFATDTDGQNAATTPVAQNYGGANAVGLAIVGGSIYMAEQGNGTVVQLNANGTFNQTIVTGIGNATALIADPFTGHLFVDSYSSGVVYDVNPLTKTATPFYSFGTSIDGLSLSPDGTILYTAVTGTSQIIGINTTTKATVFTSAAISGGIDGTAVGVGSLAGNIFVNTNGGTVVEVNLATNAQTLIASGGSRGDFVAVDPNGTLLLTQTDSILRLTAPAGGSFATPEPSSILMVGMGCVGTMILARRRRATA